MPIKARDGKGRAIRTLETVEQDRRAAELRSASLTYAQIGEQLGLSQPAAYQAATRGFQQVPTEGMVEGKRSEIAKLDRIERHLLGVMGREHLKIDHGHVVSLEGKPILDDGPGVQAAMGLLRVAERRAKLCGYDEPSRVRVEEVPREAVQAEIQRLRLKLVQ